MKKTLTTLAAVASLGAAAATPVLAQPVVTFSFGNTGYGYGGIQERQERIAWEIRQGQRMGTIDWREARRLHNQLARIEHMERVYARGGFSRAEVIDLSRRLAALENRVQVAMGDYRWGDRYGYGYGYGR